MKRILFFCIAIFSVTAAHAMKYHSQEQGFVDQIHGELLDDIRLTAELRTKAIVLQERIKTLPGCSKFAAMDEIMEMIRRGLDENRPILDLITQNAPHDFYQRNIEKATHQLDIAYGMLEVAIEEMEEIIKDAQAQKAAARTKKVTIIKKVIITKVEKSHKAHHHH